VSGKLIVGCGYLGSRVARLWRDQGHAVHIVTRSPKRATEFAADGFSPVVAEVTQSCTLAVLPAVETVLFAVGFDRSAGVPIRSVYVDGLRNVLASLVSATERFIYISSTGVYGQASGELVDEQSPCDPQREGGKACLEAERALQSSRYAQQSIILRLAGIYGPGRIPHQAMIAAGQPLNVAADAWLNLIHVEDAARLVVQLDQLGRTPLTLNVSDGRPVRRSDFYDELARLLHAPAPTFAAPTPGSPAAERARSDKRISNAALLAQLRFSFNYPTYREGLRDALRQPA
jgi:nucleoside-diphosphate-sugar epimerase